MDNKRQTKLYLSVVLLSTGNKINYSGVGKQIFNSYKMDEVRDRLKDDMEMILSYSSSSFTGRGLKHEYHIPNKNGQYIYIYVYITHHALQTWYNAVHFIRVWYPCTSIQWEIMLHLIPYHFSFLWHQHSCVLLTEHAQPPAHDLKPLLADLTEDLRQVLPDRPRLDCKQRCDWSRATQHEVEYWLPLDFFFVGMRSEIKQDVFVKHYSPTGYIFWKVYN